MSLFISKTELLEFHRCQYKPSNTQDETISRTRRFILDHDPDAPSPSPSPQSQPQPQHNKQELDIGDLIIDEESLVDDFDNETANEDVKAYLEFRQQHRAQFLQEIEDKNLHLKNESTTPMVEDIKPTPRKRNQLTMLNY